MQSFLTPAPLTLEIRNAAGLVEIDLTDTTTSTVDVQPSSGHPLGFLDDVFRAFGNRGRGREEAPDTADILDLVRIEHRQVDGGPSSLIIDTDPARATWRAAFTIRITAPTGSNIRVQCQSADLRQTGVAALAEVQTASGDIRLDEVHRNSAVQTASGDVAVRRAGADLEVRTASGDVEIGPIAGNAVVHTTSGDIRLAATGGNVSARSVSGDVRVTDAISGLTEITAVTGDVEIGVHAGSRAAVNLNTLTGDTHSDFEVLDTLPDDTAPTLSIRVKTTSGDIRLRRAA